MSSSLIPNPTQLEWRKAHLGIVEDFAAVYRAMIDASVAALELATDEEREVHEKVLHALRMTRLCEEQVEKISSKLDEVLELGSAFRSTEEAK